MASIRFVKNVTTRFGCCTCFVCGPVMSTGHVCIIVDEHHIDDNPSEYLMKYILKFLSDLNASWTGKLTLNIEKGNNVDLFKNIEFKFTQSSEFSKNACTGIYTFKR